MMRSLNSVSDKIPGMQDAVVVGTLSLNSIPVGGLHGP